MYSLLVALSCDGDRRQTSTMARTTAESMTIEQAQNLHVFCSLFTPHATDGGYANKDDQVDKLGRQYVLCKIGGKYGITFERYVELVRSGEWSGIVDHGN